MQVSRKEQLTRDYLALVDRHLDDLLAQRVSDMLELNQIADTLCVSHKHLIAVVKETRGEHPCHFYVQKIIERSKELLQDSDLPAAEIARLLSYDPSNFSKFFRKYVGKTPGQFRAESTGVLLSV